MACVRFRRGKWGVDWRDALGKRHWRPCGSEDEARKLHAAILAEHQPIRLPGYSELTLDGYAELFFAEVRARTREASVMRYRSAYRTHIAGELGERRLDDVTRFELKQFVAKLHAEGVGLTTPVKVLSMLFSSAYEDGMIQRHPAKGLRRMFQTAKPANPKAMTADELARFLDAARAEPIYRPLFRTMAFTGLRPGEARGLHVGDYSEQRGFYVARTFSNNKLSPYTKTGECAFVEVPDELRGELRALTRFRASEDWIFRRPDGSFLRKAAVRLAFMRTLRRARLPERFTPGCLRHTYASLLIQQGAPITYVQRQLRHSSIHMTADTYGRWLPLSNRRALSELVSRTEGGSVTAEAVTDDEEPQPFGKVLSFACVAAAATARTRPSRSGPVSEDEDEPEPEGAA